MTKPFYIREIMSMKIKVEIKIKNWMKIKT